MTTSRDSELESDAKSAARATEDKAKDVAGDVKDAAHSAGQKAKNVGERASDAVEDMIPGDSDRDGH